jgi:uncharacterized DUF497 family protein
MAEAVFDWNEANLSHLARHGVAREEFEQAAGNGPILLDYENVDGEDRWTGLGATVRLRVLNVVFTIRQGRLRAVTAFDAAKSDVRYYWKHRGN